MNAGPPEKPCACALNGSLCVYVSDGIVTNSIPLNRSGGNITTIKGDWMPEDLALQRLIAQHAPKPRQRTETNLVAQLVKRAVDFGCRLFRNQTGTYQLRDGRYITSGLCIGSSDLIGYTRVTIRPEDVGRTVAVFTAIEAKSATGRATDRQVAFVERVNADGGIAQIVRSVRELEFTLGKR